MTMRELVRLFRDAGWSRQKRRSWIEWRWALRQTSVALDGQPAPPDLPRGLPVEGRVPPAEPNGCGSRESTAAAATARADTGGVRGTTRPSPTSGGAG